LVMAIGDLFVVRHPVSATGWRSLLLGKIHQGFSCRILGCVSVYTANISTSCLCGVLTHESNGVLEGCLDGRSRLETDVKLRYPLMGRIGGGRDQPAGQLKTGSGHWVAEMSVQQTLWGRACLDWFDP
ncbi:MAG: hypothetical protein ACP5VS_06005, partial [Desulfomonilaceae bacterium]